MPVFPPKRRPAFKPLNRLRSGPFGGKKHSAAADLNLTPMVDMFTTVVIFLIANFSASGDFMMAQKGLVLPETVAGEMLVERGPVVTLFQGQVLLEGKPVTSLDQLDEADPGIPPLMEKLQKVRENEESLMARKGKPRDMSKPYEGILVIQADKNEDFELVRKVIHAANSAGWAKLNFAAVGVNAEGGEEGEAKEE
jgi:biopolymer transport protein ExbD